jgi:hypothetical protein
MSGGETRAADLLTVGWMLCVFTALLCEIAEAATAWAYSLQPDWVNLALLRGLLIFAATMAGIFSLVLAVVVWKVRRQPVPLGVMAFALLVGLEPLVLLAVRVLRG